MASRIAPAHSQHTLFTGSAAMPDSSNSVVGYPGASLHNEFCRTRLKRVVFVKVKMNTWERLARRASRGVGRAIVGQLRCHESEPRCRGPPRSAQSRYPDNRQTSTAVGPELDCLLHSRSVSRTVRTRGHAAMTTFEAAEWRMFARQRRWPYQMHGFTCQGRRADLPIHAAIGP